MVVVRDLSRLARDQNERVRLLLEIDESPVALHSVERGEISASGFDLVVEAAADAAKRKEIERAQRETERRVAAGFHQGRPPFGFAFDDAGEYLVPGDRFGKALDVLNAVDAGESYRGITANADVSKSTVGRIVDRREAYIRFKPAGRDGPETTPGDEQSSNHADGDGGESGHRDRRRIPGFIRGATDGRQPDAAYARD